MSVLTIVRKSFFKEEGQGTLEKAYEAMSDYIEVYDYKPETFAGIKYAFTSKNYQFLKKIGLFPWFLSTNTG